MATQAEEIAALTREAELYERLEGSRVRCFACGLNCPIPAGFAGVCKVRFNRGGKLYAPYGYVQELHLDPIEKKPFFHALPGSCALSFGMPGCNLHCPYCQNWITSQALRDFRAVLNCRPMRASQVVRMAATQGAASVISTYNEPLITSEWAADIFREAHQEGLLTGFVSNGVASRRALEFLRPSLDLFKIDLKSFNDRRYHQLGGRLAPVLDSIEHVFGMGFWLEVVTLLVPGFNDGDGELRSLARFLAGISSDIPWHVSPFHGDYRLEDTPDTTAAALRRAAEIGGEAGLRFVYAPGAGLQDTVCPGCATVLIERDGFRVRTSRLGAEGRCPQCATLIPGIWSPAAPLARAASELWVHRHCG